MANIDAARQQPECQRGRRRSNKLIVDGSVQVPYSSAGLGQHDIRLANRRRNHRLPFIVAANGDMECDAERVYATTKGGPLWALDRHTGEVDWHSARSRGYLNTAGPFLTDGTLYADDGINERIVARRASDRIVLWNVNIRVVPSVSIGGGKTLLWFTDGHFVHVLNARTGQRLLLDAPLDLSVVWAPLLLDESNAVFATENGVMRVRLR